MNISFSRKVCILKFGCVLLYFFIDCDSMTHLSDFIIHQSKLNEILVLPCVRLADSRFSGEIVPDHD